MSHTVSVDVSQPLRWPNRCARCGENHGLQSASLLVGEVLDSRLKLNASIEYQTRTTTVKYPVCAKHAKGLGIAAIFNRQTAVMKGVRAFIWVFGVLGIVPSLFAPFSLLSGKSTMPLGALLLVCVPTLLLVGLLWARRAQPVQGVRRDGDDLTLRFTNEAYGVSFERANRERT